MWIEKKIIDKIACIKLKILMTDYYSNTLGAKGLQ
jgi:hypothetical protein